MQAQAVDPSGADDGRLVARLEPAGSAVFRVAAVVRAARTAGQVLYHDVGKENIGHVGHVLRWWCGRVTLDVTEVDVNPNRHARADNLNVPPGHVRYCSSPRLWGRELKSNASVADRVVLEKHIVDTP